MQPLGIRWHLSFLNFYAISCNYRSNLKAFFPTMQSFYIFCNMDNLNKSFFKNLVIVNKINSKFSKVRVEWVHLCFINQSLMYRLHALPTPLNSY